MNRALLIILIAATALLMAVAFFMPAGPGATVGVASGSALPGFSPKANTPEQAMANVLLDVKRRNWDRAFVGVSKTSGVDERAFIEDWTGSSGSLRTFSNLEGFESRPLHATNDEAQMRVRLHWSTPVGPEEEARDFRLMREGDTWKVVWPHTETASVPAQVIPVDYLRWDLVSGGAEDEWGARNVDAPHVRIL